MKMNNAKLYKIDNQGHLKFPLRTEIVRNFGKADSIWEHPAVSIVIMVVCGLLDLVMFRQLFSSFLYDSKAVQILSIIAMLIGFDLAPILGGHVLKKRQQGLDSGGMAVVYGLAFMLAFTWNIVLRIQVKDMVLPDLSSAMTSILGGTSEVDTTNSLALVYALFASALPVITSLVSFGASFQSSNPLGKQVKKLREEQIAIEDDIVEIEALLMEYEEDLDHFKRLLEEDEQKYQNMIEMLHEKMVFYCDYVRERLKEHLGNPTSSNELSKDNRTSLLSALEDTDRLFLKEEH